MSRIKVDRITDKAGTGAPILVNGMNVTGKSTMGDIVGAAVTFNSITGGSANFSSDVSIGGTLTYEDVKNVDSVGLITARSGINITGGDLNAASNLILKVDGTERVRTTTAGNFGINDNNPANQLVVKAPGGSGHCAAKVLSGDTSTALFLQSIQGSEGRLGVESNHPLALYAGTAERLRIGTAGQLGINGANYGTSGQVLTSGGASSVVQWADVSGGLSEVDEWGQFSGDGNTSYGPWSPSNGQWGNNNQTGRLLGELTRSSVSNMPKGTGMSHTNGVFTFPSTGLWEIACNFLIQRYNTNGNTNVMLQHSTDSGSSYITGVDSTYLASGYMFIASNAYHPRGTLSLNAILNVTNASTFRVRVVFDFGGSPLYVRPNSRIIFKKVD